MKDNFILSDVKLLSIVFNEIISPDEVKSPYVYDLKKAQNNVTIHESGVNGYALKPLDHGMTPHHNTSLRNKKNAVHRQVLSYLDIKRAFTNRSYANFLFSNAYNSALIGLTEILGDAALIDPHSKIVVTFLEPENFTGYEMRTTITMEKSN